MGTSLSRGTFFGKAGVATTLGLRRPTSGKAIVDIFGVSSEAREG
jgi:hypothetical protein